MNYVPYRLFAKSFLTGYMDIAMKNFNCIIGKLDRAILKIVIHLYIKTRIQKFTSLLENSSEASALKMIDYMVGVVVRKLAAVQRVVDLIPARNNPLCIVTSYCSGTGCICLKLYSCKRTYESSKKKSQTK